MLDPTKVLEELTDEQIGRYTIDRMNDTKTKFAILDHESGREFPCGVSKFKRYVDEGIIVVHDDKSFSCDKWSEANGLDF